MIYLLLMTTSLASACTALDVSASGVAELSVSASGYDAIVEKGRRKAPSAVTMHEDRHLNQSDRRKLIGGMRDLRRNSSLLDWMVRNHLNYVCEHRFQATTGDDDFDDQLEAILAVEFRAANLDEREVCSLAEFVRIAEAMAVLDGDCGTLFVDGGGGRLQGIEADRIRDPSGAAIANQLEWFNGVRATPSGRPIAYAISRRNSGSSLEHERIVAAANFHLHAYRARFDQHRGVSPVASAYNQIRDIYEAEELAMVRSKVASLFAMAITRNAEQAAGDVAVELDDDGKPIKSSYSVDFGRGPVFLDLEPGDDAKFLDSNNPGANMQEFWQFVTLIALKSLDLPYGLFDESVANFFGNKTAWISYDRACDPKRARVRDLLDRITAFKIGQLIRSRRIALPRINGRQITLADRPWTWVPRGMPWWRPLEEVTANLKAIGGGLTTPQKVCIEADQGDFYDNIDQIAKANAYARKKGVRLTFDLDSQTEALAAAKPAETMPPEQQRK